MSTKSLLFVLTCHQGYIRHVADEEKYAAENDLLFSSISGCYLPLLRMLRRLAADGVPCRLSLVISPVVCSLLGDPVVQQQYIEWLDRHIALGKQEYDRCGTDESLLADALLGRYQADRRDFVETYGQNLLREFARLAKQGVVELLATAGTYAFLPHYADMTEILNAQVETGLYAHRHFFGSRPDGFWLPYMGYAPGVEKVLRAYGFSYTFVDTHALLFGESQASDGIFSPVRCPNFLTLLARDTTTPDDLIGAAGFARNGCYRDVNRDIGYELDSSMLGPFMPAGTARHATGFRYRARSGALYDAAQAQTQVRADAELFVARKTAKLLEAERLLGGRDVSLVCVLPLDEICPVWEEGIDFLEAAVRTAVAEVSGLRVCGGSQVLEKPASLQKLRPFPSAATGAGYGEDLLDSTNGWMLRYTRKMCERMVDLAGRFPAETGLKARLLNLAARELMIAQGAEWAKMLHDGQNPDYVREHFTASIRAFITVFDSLGSNTVSTGWLTQLEREHTLFSWMNYRIFSRKR